METGLIVARFLHIAAVLILFGTALFPFYAAVDGCSKTVRAAGGVIALVGGLAWLAFTTHAITGSVSSDAIGMVIVRTAFGTLWLTRLILAGLVIALALLPARRWISWIELIAATILLVTLAGTGHAQLGEPGWLHVGADTLHLAAAGAWIGGLLSLGFALAMQDNIKPLLTRFSAMGMTAVAVLMASGIINSWFLVGTPRDLLTTAYGQVLLIKLVLFSGMLALATINRFVLMPKLDNDATWPRLMRAVVGEQSLGLIVLALVALMGTLEPAL